MTDTFSKPTVDSDAGDLAVRRHARGAAIQMALLVLLSLVLVGATASFLSQ